MPKHRSQSCQCVATREPSALRGFYKLMVIWGIICTAAYVTVPYWPI